MPRDMTHWNAGEEVVARITGMPFGKRVKAMRAANLKVFVCPFWDKCAQLGTRR